MEPTINEEIMGWIRQAREHSASEQSTARAYDIGRKIEFLTVDIITRICLGTAFGCVASDSDKYDFLNTVKQGTPFCQYLSIFHELNSLLFYITKIPIISRYFIPRSSDGSGIGRILGVSSAQICLESLINSNQVVRSTRDQPKDVSAGAASDLLTSFIEKGVPDADAELFITL